MISWHVGRRDAQTAYPFMHDLASRSRRRVQLTTDGLHAYLEATDVGVRHGHRLCEIDKSVRERSERRAAIRAARVHGDKGAGRVRRSGDRAHLDQLHRAAESQMRMSMRRFTRLTNGHSQEGGEPRARAGAALRALQLRASAEGARRHACDGGWPCGLARGRSRRSSACWTWPRKKRRRRWPLQRSSPSSPEGVRSELRVGAHSRRDVTVGACQTRRNDASRVGED